MKRIACTLCALTTVLLFSCSNDKKEGDKKEPVSGDTKMASNDIKVAPPAEVDSATQAKNWQEYAMVTDVQKMMAKWDGTWNSEVTVWMPGAPEMKSTGTTVNKMIMGGRYQQTNHTGQMMGQPFEGEGTLAYDNHRKEFISTWIDNMGTGMMILKGPWDDATKSITLKGQMVDPGTKADTDVKEVFTVIDDNTQEMKMYVMTPDGKEFQTMNIKFTRKK